MTHGSLFSGIGGFDLAAEWMRWENVFHCEINEFCQKVLKYYWPNAQQYTDIKQSDFSVWRGRIDILSGGFPCQPYSAAGKRKGKADDRHLWPEMLRAVREIQPRWVVGENVYGLVNWSKGLVFDEVQTDLENEGYQVTPYILPACAVNAPHRRDRIWFVAHSTGNRRSGNGKGIENENREKRSGESRQLERGFKRLRSNEYVTDTTGKSKRESSNKIDTIANERKTRIEFGGNSRIITDSDSSIGCEGRLHETGPETTEGHVSARDARINERGTWDNFPTQSPVRSRNDGLSGELAGITFSKHRNESIKAYGNAIVPQVAYEIFKTIQQYEQQ